MPHTKSYVYQNVSLQLTSLFFKIRQASTSEEKKEIEADVINRLGTFENALKGPFFGGEENPYIAKYIIKLSHIIL